MVGSPGCSRFGVVRCSSCPTAVISPVIMILRLRSPTRPVPARVDVSKGAVGGVRPVHTYPAYQRRMCPFDALGRGTNELCISNVDPAIPVQVVHAAVSVVVDVDVGGV